MGLLVLLLVPALGGADKKVIVSALRPAGQQDVITQIPGFAIQFRGAEKAVVSNLASAITDQLSRVQLDGETLYNVSNRSDLDLILGELDFQQSGDAVQVAQRSKIAGLRYLLTGNADIQSTQHHLSETRGVIDYNVCLEYSSRGSIDLDLGDGKRHGNVRGSIRSTETCTRFGTRLVTDECTITEYVYTARVALLDVQSGKQVYSRSFARTDQPHSCLHHRRRKDSGQYAQEFAQEVRLDFAPHIVQFQAHLLTKPPKGLKRKQRKEWKYAKRLLKSYVPPAVDGNAIWWRKKDVNRWSGHSENLKIACGIYEDFYRNPLATDSPYVLHNQGVCREYEGDLEGAEKFYQQALISSVSQRKKPDKATPLALDRVRSHLDFRMRTIEQLQQRERATAATP